MSTAVDTDQLEEIVESGEVFVRSFEADLAPGDGRTLDARLVPYNAPALVADPPDFRPYREEFAPGAFARQVRAFNRVKVWLNFEHDRSLRGVIGHGLSLEDRGDALYGSFKLNEEPDGEKALYLVREGLLPGISVEFLSLREQKVNGVVRRLAASLQNVALCRSPAYEDAQVLAVREEPPEVVERVEPVVVPALSDELTERLAALGVVPLERMATTAKPWDGSPARFTDEQYQRSALFCRAGDAPPKERCSLPVLEPDGTLNTSALGAAAAALAGARGGLRNVSQAEKAAAARKLVRYYRSAGQEPPESLLALARS